MARAADLAIHMRSHTGNSNNNSRDISTTVTLINILLLKPFLFCLNVPLY